MYRQFRNYLNRHGRSLKSQSRVTQLKAFLGFKMKSGSQGGKKLWKMTTVRTAFGHLVGEIQRRSDRKLDSVAVKELARWLENATRISTKNKAPPIMMKDLPGVLKKTRATGTEANMMETLIRTCCRVGNLHHLVHMQWTATEQWTAMFRTHKTRAHNIYGNIELNGMNFSPKLKTFLSTLKEGTSVYSAQAVETLKKKLHKSGIRLHSFRRGGILELFRNKTPLDRIRALTKHTTDGQLLEYLDTIQI